MHVNQFFGGCGLFSFGDFAPFSFAFETAKFWTVDYSPWGSKNRIDSKFFASRSGYEMLMHQVLWALGRGIPLSPSICMYILSVCLFPSFPHPPLPPSLFPLPPSLFSPSLSLPSSLSLLSLPLSLFSPSLSLCLTGNRNGLLVPNTTTDQVTHIITIFITIIIIITIVIVLLGVAAFT